MRGLALVSATFLLLIGCGGERRQTVPIPLSLPAKLDLTNYEYVYFPGFVSDVENELFSPEEEALNFFKRELVRKDVVDVVDSDPIDLSDKDPRAFFEREQPYFTTLEIENAESTLAITGVVSFEARDLSSFRRVQNETINGQIIYQTQFVEMTGFELNMRVFVYDVGTGRLLFREVLADRLDVQGQNADQRLAYYDLLQRVADRVTGLFSNTVVQDERILK